MLRADSILKNHLEASHHVQEATNELGDTLVVSNHFGRSQFTSNTDTDNLMSRKGVRAKPPFVPTSVHLRCNLFRNITAHIERTNALGTT
jgi:hypothetical protein